MYLFSPFSEGKTEKVSDFCGFQLLIPDLNQYSSFPAKSKKIFFKNKDITPFFNDFVLNGGGGEPFGVFFYCKIFFILLY